MSDMLSIDITITHKIPAQTVTKKITVTKAQTGTLVETLERIEQKVKASYKGTSTYVVDRIENISTGQILTVPKLRVTAEDVRAAELADQTLLFARLNKVLVDSRAGAPSRRFGDSMDTRKSVAFAAGRERK